jgi:hypothetical protein
LKKLAFKIKKVKKFVFNQNRYGNNAGTSLFTSWRLLFRSTSSDNFTFIKFLTMWQSLHKRWLLVVRASLWYWDYCSPPPDTQGILKTRYGQTCNDNCSHRGYDYFWSTQYGTFVWDYCSPYSHQTPDEVKWPLHSMSLGSTYMYNLKSGTLVDSHICESECRRDELPTNLHW